MARWTFAGSLGVFAGPLALEFTLRRCSEAAEQTP